MPYDPRWKRCFLASSLVAMLFGCSMMGNRMAWNNDGPPPQSEPEVTSDAMQDKWGFVGKEARGHRAPDDENDPLKPLLMSDEARRIERNLGYK
uniref:Membrane or secreted protein n=1 Tax=Schlesneria paludicola TaxID=360056 RepID=A0A7C2K160_9PLAN